MMKKIAAMLLAAMLLTGVCAGAMAEENRIWKTGDTGEEVRRIQEKLISLGYLEKEADGVFDAATEEAVLWFQRVHGLLQTGMADRVTEEALMNETARAPQPAADDAGADMAMEDVFFFAPTSKMSGAGAVMPPSVSAEGMWEELGFNTDEYSVFDSNRFLSVLTSPLSTFAADVDTSSYAQLRRRVLMGQPVPADSVRIAEMLNYFYYAYAQPANGEPFGMTAAYGPCPWNPETRLLQIGLQAAAVGEENRPPHNLVFLIDTSGSMEGADRLDLVKRAFLLLLEELDENDTVSIVTYASQDRVVLEGVPASEKTRIMEAINELNAAGATNGAAGLTRAYELAERCMKPGGVNRILLATDGDLNVGPSSESDLARLVQEKKQSGISLTCLGFGMGNYKDNKMEALANYGDGNCWYIDTIYEARRALVTEGGGTFITVASDVKIQVDFNPAYVAGYRLIGYEDRLLAAEAFADDSADGGEVGSGHRVTALYEIVPVGSAFDFGQASSRYQQSGGEGNLSGELLTVSVRAKKPGEAESTLYEYPVSSDSYSETMNDNQLFAAAVAEVGMILRDCEWKGSATYASALDLLRRCGSVMGDPYKEEFLYLVTLLDRAGQPGA